MLVCVAGSGKSCLADFTRNFSVPRVPKCSFSEQKRIGLDCCKERKPLSLSQQSDRVRTVLSRFSVGIGWMVLDNLLQLRP